MSERDAVDEFATPGDREASELGTWIFLVTEILLFGGFFVMYAAQRLAHPAAFAEASAHLDITLGTVNTAVLMTSSLTMVMAVELIERRPRIACGCLTLTWMLGGAFLAIKATEYARELAGGVPLAQPGAGNFWWLYFAMTGLHAAHLVSGMGAVGYFALRTLRFRGEAQAALPRRVRITGLYWHLVDVLWLFIFPLFYLVARHA